MSRLDPHCRTLRVADRRLTPRLKVQYCSIPILKLDPKDPRQHTTKSISQSRVASQLTWKGVPSFVIFYRYPRDLKLYPLNTWGQRGGRIQIARSIRYRDFLVPILMESDEVLLARRAHLLVALERRISTAQGAQGDVK